MSFIEFKKEQYIFNYQIKFVFKTKTKNKLKKINKKMPFD